MGKSFFDYDTGNMITSIGNDMAIGSDGTAFMRISDNLVMDSKGNHYMQIADGFYVDLGTDDLHQIVSWDDDQ